MNSDSQFEKRLGAQPVKSVPTEWRNDILREAKRAAHVRADSHADAKSVFETIGKQIASLLWPAPKAWAGLVGAWIAIGLMNFSGTDGAAGIAQTQPFPSRETMQSLKQQQQLLAELVERFEAPKAEWRRTPSSAPRSQRRAETATI